MTNYFVQSAVAGNNEEKLMISISTTPDVNNVAWNNDTATITITYQAYQAKYSGDNQTLNRTGSWSGSTNFYMPATANTTVTIATDTRTIALNQGSTTYIEVGGNITGHYGGASFSAVQGITFNARPYPSSQVSLSASTFDMGTNITINTNRLDGTFTHTIRYAFGGASGTIATGVGANTSWTFPTNILAPQIPNTAAGSGTILCDTYNGGNFIGTTTVAFTANVPTSIVPSIPTLTFGESVSAVTSNVGTYVKLLSLPTVVVGNCSTANTYGASIAQVAVIYDGNAYNVTNGQNINSLTYQMQQVIQKSGVVTFTGRVTDSRGRSSSADGTITVLNYSYPNITGFTLQRCNSDGSYNAIGTYVKIVSAGSVSSLVNGTEKNTASYAINYRERGTSNWLPLKVATPLAGLSLNNTDVLGGSINVTKAYEFQLLLIDKFNTTISQSVLGTGAVTLSLNKTGIGVGKVWERGAIDAAGRIYDQTGFVMPVGTILPYAALTSPDGFILCNGASVNRTTYSDLFAVIGTSFGAGDGSTTFGIPNLSGRFPLGYMNGYTSGVWIETWNIGSPHVVSYAPSSAKFMPYNGMAVRFTTTGSLGTGLSVNTTYYISNLSYNGAYPQFNLSAVPGGSAIATSGTSSGSINMYAAQSSVLGNYGGEEFHFPSSNEIPSHSHIISARTTAGGNMDGLAASGSGTLYTNNTGTHNFGYGSGGNNMPLFTVVNYIIKY